MTIIFIGLKYAWKKRINREFRFARPRLLEAGHVRICPYRFDPGLWPGGFLSYLHSVFSRPWIH